MNGIFSPPYWPLNLTEYKGTVCIRPLRCPFQIGEISIEGMTGNHPGGSMIFRLSAQGKRLIYATDYEYDDESFGRLAAFSENADLILYDGQYREADMSVRKGYGHSTMEQGIQLLERSGAKRLLLIHHDPYCPDEVMRKRNSALRRENVGFARQGAVIMI